MSDRIRFEEVWKAYPRWGGRTLREALDRRLPGLLAGGDQRWVLREVSFSVAHGEFVGVIGLNGAGKSTLLRLAAGVAVPTRGRVLLPDETAAILNLGDLFDPALNGRENALTTALAAGLTARRARALMPEIVAFAELEGFEDAPLRTYSDGMRLRLAFGVLAQLAPDALLLDEVIAVGDLRFRQKCLDYVHARCADGAGVLFASHSLDEVARHCSRAVWLEAGGLRAVGEAEAVITAYRDAMHSETRDRTPPPAETSGDLELRRNRFGSQEASIVHVELRDGVGRPASTMASGGPLEISFVVRTSPDQRVSAPIVGVAISRAADGTTCYDTNTANEGLLISEIAGERRFALVFERLDLIPGDYFIDIGVYERDWRYAYDYHWHAHSLRVLGSSRDGGVFQPPHRWEVGEPVASRTSRS
jgi:homopolymeric O-antigen transport system ATP-binding protein